MRRAAAQGAEADHRAADRADQKDGIAIDPQWARRRYEQALADRKVVGYRNPDGSANLSGYNLPWDRVAAAGGHIDALAKAAKRAGDTRPIDHIRADLFLGMTDGTYTGLDDACRHDHRLKGEGGWALHQPKPGVFRWTSRLGHTYERQPPAIIEPLPDPIPRHRPPFPLTIPLDDDWEDTQIWDDPEPEPEPDPPPEPDPHADIPPC